ncbi:hypothetical protein QJS04_geneDACA024005 [Acorus gramineus]|uniref:CCHC-type domain-containing protein n=1 Tax=Acorus gramineus TaxID=55184 RepID=A0AAV9BY76_ACOGR|nr:hypothetical protein QJS04_geneDACA024005 [Acorus gramineus]
MTTHFILNFVSPVFRNSLQEFKYAKDLLDHIEQRFAGTSKAKKQAVFQKFHNLKLAFGESVKEHILRMIGYSNELASLGSKLDEDYICHVILNSLPRSYESFQINYNTSDLKWTLDELLNHCVLEEERQARNKNEYAHLVVTDAKGKQPMKKKKFKKSGKSKKNFGSQKKEQKPDQRVCFYCKQPGHFKAECPKLKKKQKSLGQGIVNSFVCTEINYVDVPSNTWWLDSGCTIHISKTLQGFLDLKKLKEEEMYVYMGNNQRAAVLGVGSYVLKFHGGRSLDLESILYASDMRCNLVSIGKLDDMGLSIFFKVGKFLFFFYFI